MDDYIIIKYFIKESNIRFALAVEVWTQKLHVSGYIFIYLHNIPTLHHVTIKMPKLWMQSRELCAFIFHFEVSYIIVQFTPRYFPSRNLTVLHDQQMQLLYM